MKKTVLLSIGFTFSSALGANVLQQHQRLAGFETLEAAPQAVPSERVQESVTAQPQPQPVVQPELTTQSPSTVSEIKPVSSSLEYEAVTALPVETPPKERKWFIEGAVVEPLSSETAVEPTVTPAPIPPKATPVLPVQVGAELDTDAYLDQRIIYSPLVSLAGSGMPPDPLSQHGEEQVESGRDRFSSTELTPLQINREALKTVTSEYLTFDSEKDEAAQPSTLIEMVRKALHWHPSVRQARSQILASQEQIEAAKAGYYPQISTGITGGYRDSNGSGNEALNVTAKQMLYDFGKVSSTVRAAEHGLNQEQARLLQSVDHLIEKTSFASLELMRLQEKQAVAQQQLNALEDIWHLAKERAELGASAQSDVIQTLSRKEGATALIWELKAQADIWVKELQSLTGERRPVHLGHQLPPQLAQQCTNQVLDVARVPMIRIVEEERNTALAHLDLSTAEMYPTLSVDAGYDQYLRRRDNWVNGRMQNRRSDYSVMLNMSMSLFEGGGKVARRNAAQHQLQAVESEKESALLEVTRGFEESQTKQLILGQRLYSLGDRIQSIETTQDLYKQQYIALGTRSLLDLLNTEQEIYHARSDYIDNKYEMIKAQIACLYYSGQLRDVFEVATLLQGGLRD